MIGGDGRQQGPDCRSRYSRPGALKDRSELDYLKRQPTSFVLYDEAVVRLRTAAGMIISGSLVKRLLEDANVAILPSLWARAARQRWRVSQASAASLLSS